MSPLGIGSSPTGRRSYGRRGTDLESERTTPDSCGSVNVEGRESVGRGAEFLGISTRQIKRLRKKMRERGVEGLLHGNRGRRPWNRTVKEVVKKVLGLAQGRYKGLNDAHLTEKLGVAGRERFSVDVSGGDR